MLDRSLLSWFCFREELHWTACFLHCVSAIWVNPYKGALRLINQPMGWRASLTNRSCASVSSFASLLTTQSGCISTNQDSVFRPNQTMRIWNSQLHENESIRDQEQELLYVIQFHLSAERTFGFRRRLCSPAVAATPAEAVTPELWHWSCNNRVISPDLLFPSHITWVALPKPLWLCCFAPELFIHAVPQPSRFTIHLFSLSKVFSSPHPKLGTPGGVELMKINFN